jgi:hypothetical protein
MAVLPTTPTAAGFLDFVRNGMGIPVGALPDTSYWLDVSYQAALAVANPDIAIVAPIIWPLAVYNLGGSYLLSMAVDPIPTTVTININGDAVPYFQALRRQYGLNSFKAGVISSSSDEGTSESMLVADWFKDLTLANLQQLKDPYGRAYLAWAQSAGSLWGIS